MTSVLQAYIEHEWQHGHIPIVPGNTFELDNEFGQWLWIVPSLIDPSLQLVLLDVSPFKGHVYDPLLDPVPSEPHYPINASHALTTTNQDPILLLQIGRPDDPDTILFETILDGWHRTYKTLATGGTKIPAYIIPPGTEPVLRLYHRPPGDRP